MKTKLTTIIAALALAQSAHATLIDLTPGGFYVNNPPQVFYDLLMRHSQIGGASIDGDNVLWSPFEPFGSNEFSIDLTEPGALVAWKLTQTAGYMCTFVLVEGVRGVGDHIYQVRKAEFVTGSGFVTTNGVTPIRSIIFFGSNVVPDSGASLSLFVGAAAVLIFSHHFRKFGKARRRKSA
jgi:hypothetical protein